MRIHTNLNVTSVHRAVPAGVSMARCDEYGSRSHDRAFDVLLEGNSGRRANFGAKHEAAMWDEWGIFIHNLYMADPEAKIPYYDNVDDFKWKTNSRFDTLTVADMCNHKWDFSGHAVTGSYSVFSCKKCPAIKRYSYA